MGRTSKASKEVTQQQRLVLVLERLIEMVKGDEDFAQYFAPDLDDLLTNIHEHDGFGTEGQSDPRGDFRNGAWSMDHVEGLD